MESQGKNFKIILSFLCELYDIKIRSIFREAGERNGNYT